ncbi:hypothetical protein FGE12_03380 [Aggregicoccus sp. 17bor-14]|uniref:hypothetical protein n=1 Tax=Myxococcaceae TaxID=31 RepID=UPI00129C17FB|nr:MULTISPECIES: hypothetical protein [Myxococcaceae]MBF5041416.1 hypothetical protein [Simulacricoccus sp. 17bor-14]MRI87200.1 hypothetical protein [Aggregicoccus sp. 17bor-14]
MTRSLLRPPLAALALLLALPAGATSLLRADVPELTAASDAVVRGTVRRVQSRWSGDGQRIVTDVEIEVAEALKGDPGHTVLVTQPGGRVGDVGQKVSGLAAFAPGEEVVVFLQRRGPSAFGVRGMAQGKFHVQRSADGKSVLAVPESLGDARLVDAATGAEVAPTQRTVSLESLRGTVRAAAARPAPAGKPR